jgi:hypothetical protein
MVACCDRRRCHSTRLPGLHDRGAEAVILVVLASIFFKGSAILVGSLSVMRLLYRFGICEPPRLANDLIEHDPMPEHTSPAVSPATDDTTAAVEGVPG